MKNLILCLLILSNLSLNGQIVGTAKKTSNSSLKVKSAQKVHKNNIKVYPIISGKVSATPISIPSKNNESIVLSPQKSTFNIFSNETDITKCSFSKLTGDSLVVSIDYKIKQMSNAPIYVGGWFYDENDKAIDAGYISGEIKKIPTGNINFIMVFNNFPVTTTYIEVMLRQDGNTILKKRFNAAYKWDELYADVDLKDLVFKTKVDPAKLMVVSSDLEITEIKAGLRGSTFSFEKNCQYRNKLIFVKNIGQKESAGYILKIGYIKYTGNRGRYIHIKSFKMPTLLPGIETYREVVLPNKVNNIIAEIQFLNNNQGEKNLENNYLEKRCK